MKITGIHTESGDNVKVAFSQTIEHIESVQPPDHDGEPIYVAPGWIDLQVNGCAGVDYNDPKTPHEEIARSIHVQFSTGVTRLFPTVVTNSYEHISSSLRNLAQARSALSEGVAIEGLHLEGPYISSEDGARGAHLKEFVRPPDLGEFQRFQEAADGHIVLLTLAPEWPEAPRFIEEVTQQGVVVSIGHTNASASQLRDAVSAGASMSTHLGNASVRTMSRHPNLLWEQLAEDRLMATFIADGFHLPQSFLQSAWRAKESSRSILITDASTPAYCAPGSYRIGQLDVEFHADGSIRMAGETRLAGSALSLSDALSNLLETLKLSLGEGVHSVTTNPAIAARIPGRQRGLSRNERADLVRFAIRDGHVCILETYVDGHLVFERKNEARG